MPKLKIPKDYYFTSIEQWNHNDTFGVRWYSTNDKRDFVLVLVEKPTGNASAEPTVTLVTPHIPATLIDPIRYSAEDFQSWLRRGRP